MKSFWSYIKASWYITKLNISSLMEYKAAFISQVFGMAINDVGLLMLWVIFFASFKSVNGWGMQQTMVLFSISTTSLGLLRAIANGTQEMARKIPKGEMDYFLTLPKNVLWQVAFSESDISGWGDALFGVLLFLFFVHPSPLQMLIFIVVNILAALILNNFAIIFHSAAFFFGEFEETAERLFVSLLLMGLYPETAFSGVLKMLSFTVLPALFIAWIPVRLLESFNWTQVGYMLLFFAGSFALAVFIFKKGLRRYESGNLINVRM